MSRGSSWLTVEQPRLGFIGFMVLLMASTLMAPLALDMYTPAVPEMPGHFGTDEATIGITLSGFFLCFTLSMPVFGPLSDKYGRRPLLIASYAFFMLGALGCAVAPNVAVLIVSRLVQGFGAGGACALSTAIVKDAFVPEKRGSVLSIMQVLFVVGPVAAPIIGALIISVLDWRATFWLLAAIGALGLIASVLMRETEPGREAGERDNVTFADVARGFAKVASNRGFMVFLAAIALFDVGYMAYVAVGSYVYMDFFGLSELGYSLLFALGAIVGATGPIVCTMAERRIGLRRCVSVCIVALLAAGVLIVTVGHVAVAVFAVIILAVPFMQSCLRPSSTNVLLDQQEGDTGSASALINFIRGIVGVAGMLIAALPIWPDYVTALGVLTAVSMVLALAFWAALLRSKVPVIGLKGESAEPFLK